MNNIIKLKEISSHFKVLVVEDNEALAKEIVNYLSKLFKKVIYATNGEDGLKLYKENKFEIVISDIAMPQMNGLVMSAEIKKIDFEQNIIIISAYSDINKFLSSIKLSIDEYIIKPINFNDMNNILYKICIRVQKLNAYKESEKEQKLLMEYITQKNLLLSQHIKIMNKVAIVSKTDLKGIITYANEFFYEVSGYDKEEIIGKNHNIVRHPDMPQSVYAEMWKTIKSGKVWEGTIKNKAKDGSAYFVYSTIMSTINDEHNIDGYIGFRFLTTKDEMDKREFKKKVRSSYQEYKKLNYEAVKKIELLEDQLSNKSAEHNLQQFTLDAVTERLQKSLAQIKFYEEKIKNEKIKKERSLLTYSSTIADITEKYKKIVSIMNIKKSELDKLKEDNKYKKNELLKLNTELIEQSDIIKDLRDTIKNIDEDYANKEKESLFTRFIK